MPKKTKTRKQKITADNRQQVQQDTEPTNMQSLPTYSIDVAKHTVSRPKVNPIHAAAITTVEYSYLSKELLKTVSVTVAIISAEIVLFTLTKGVL